LQATLLAMKRAIEALRLPPKLVLVDGNRLPTLSIRAEAIVQGDALVPAISAASILAKVHRDRLCQAMHQQYPLYLEALQAHGPADCHRMTFAPVARSVR
jgi:ribonuclease HII